MECVFFLKGANIINFLELLRHVDLRLKSRKVESKSRVENYLKSGLQSSRLLDMSSSKLS